MKKNLSIVLLMALIFTLICVGCGKDEPKNGGEKPAKAIVLRYADTVKDTDVDGIGAFYFADLVSKRTDGQVKIEFYGSSQLGSDKVITQAALAGTIDIVKCSSGNFAEYSQALAFTELPGLFRDMQHCRNMWNSDIRNMITDQIVKETTLYPLMFDIDGGEPRAFCSNSPVYVPSDAAGLKLRTTGSPVEIALFEAWGAGATTVEFSELYTAMQQNMIDGYYLQPAYICISKLEEATKYVTYVNQSWVSSVKLISPAAIEKLGGIDSELFKIVAEAAHETEEYKATLWADLYDGYRQTITKAGCEVINLTDEQLAEWDAVSAKIWSKFVGTKISQDLVDKVKAL